MDQQLKIGKVELCNAVGKCMSSPQSYSAYMNSSWSKPTATQVAKHAQQQLEAARLKDVETHTRNVGIIEANEAIHEQVTALMIAVGMPSTWSEPDTKSRARYPKSIRHDAGYLIDLRREARTSDGFDYATTTYQNLKKKYDEYERDAAREDELARTKAEREQAAQKAERRANIEQAAIILRYGLDIDSEWSDILRALRERDKHLDLAIAMSDVRGDWSDGPGEVRDALDRFSVESNRDKEIANDVIDGLTDFEDGRVFRDCRWSYDALYAIVEDEQLVTDAQLARAKARGY